MSDHQEQDDDYGYQGDADRLSNDGDIDPSHSVTRDGGTLRVSVGSGERLKALAARDRAQAEGRVKTDSRAQVRTQVHSTEPAQAAPQAFRIVSSSGRVLPAAEVNAQSIIHIGEKTVEVGIAESVGLVERDGAGNLVLTKKGAIYGGLDDGDVPAEAATNEATNESTPDATKQLTTPESKAEDAAIDKASQAMNDVPGEIVTSVMARAVEGNVDVEEIARSLGVSAEEAEQRYSTISAGYEAEANSHLRGLGVKDADGFRGLGRDSRTHRRIPSGRHVSPRRGLGEL